MAEWRDVKDHEGQYQVSDNGQVRNIHTATILQPLSIRNGRQYVSLSSAGFQRKATVHSLLANAFLGERPPGREITHKDGDCTNNAVANLEYISRQENQKRFVMRSGGYSVNITKRVMTAGGSRYCPVVLSANGRAKPDYVLVDGREERHLEGAYYIEWRENGKRRRLSVGKNAGEAMAQRLRKEAELNARNHGVSVAPESKNGRRLLSVAITDYLEEVKLSKKPKTHAAYSKALVYFQESCAKMNLEDIERKDLLKYTAFLRDEKDQSPRSVANKFENVMSFLKSRGIRGSDLRITKHDWPQYTMEEPEIYEKEDLETLFAVCCDVERLWFEFFLMTGMREQEVMHTYWTDVNLKANTVRVTHKPDRGWEPKRYKEREIPVPERLAESLRAWKMKRNPSCPLVFATKGCNVKRDFLDCLKRVAERAKLDPDNFWLHKFRATFATWSLWAGVDLRTVQQWLGHTDMESTMRYLKPSRSQQVREKMDTTFA